MADIVLKPVDAVLYKAIKPYMIENFAAFSKQSRIACEKEIDALLIDGENTKDHYLYAIDMSGSYTSSENGFFTDVHGSISSAYTGLCMDLCAGYVWFFAVEKKGRKIAFLMDIFVFPEYRRRGIARQTLVLSEHLMSGHGYDTIRLYADDTKAAAKNMYAGLGYRFLQRAKNGEILEKRIDVQNKASV